MSETLKEDICDIRLPGTLTSEIDRCKIDACLPREIQYACQYWGFHLERGKYSDNNIT
jgi:hypothetical protein